MAFASSGRAKTWTASAPWRSTWPGVHPHDVGQFIDAQGIAIRVGHHCAQPVHRHFGLYASNRASSGVYNSVEDAQALVEAAKGIRKFFGVE